MLRNRRVLICGGGIAGISLAYWLHQYGFAPVIVEKSHALRDAGYMIDFYGSGYDVAEKMGILPQLGQRHYPVPELDFVNSRGQTQSRIELEKMRQLLNYRHFNFMRGDLVDILYAQIQDHVPVHFGVTIADLRLRPDGVDVTFADGRQQTVDLVIGADGYHSQVRALLWGAESQFAYHLGYQVCCGIIDDFLGNQDTFYSYLEPGKQAAVYPIRGGRLATFFVWQSPPRLSLSPAEQMTMLKETFAGMGWAIPQVVKEMMALPRFYFDTVSQIRMPSWYQGRVALVGDACQCLTLVSGQGASMALAGAYLLAEQLRLANGDHERAFAAYQAQLKPEIEERQVRAEKFARSFVPHSAFGIRLQNLYLKVAFLPGFRLLFKQFIGAKSIIK